jgi:hypothetical protein
VIKKITKLFQQHTPLYRPADVKMITEHRARLRSGSRLDVVVLPFANLSLYQQDNAAT